MPPYPGSATRGSTIDLGFAAELGALLSKARADRALTIDQVAERLLLSPRQVRALEQPDPTAFYGEPYFVKGLQKYVEFVGVGGLSEPLFERMLAIPGRDDAAQAPVEPRPRAPRVPLSGRTRLLIAMAVLGIGLLGASYYYERPASAPPGATSAAQAPAVAEPVVVQASAPFDELRPAVAPEPLVAEVPPTPEAPTAPAAPVRAVAPASTGAAGRVSVGRATWVFVRYANNETVERVLQPGQALDLAGVPIYLAVGIDDGVDLTLGGRPVDVSPFVTDKHEVRIGRAELATLARAPGR